MQDLLGMFKPQGSNVTEGASWHLKLDELGRNLDFGAPKSNTANSPKIERNTGEILLKCALEGGRGQSRSVL